MRNNTIQSGPSLIQFSRFDASGNPVGTSVDVAAMTNQAFVSTFAAANIACHADGSELRC